MKRLLQVSGGVTGSGADLHAPSARERPTSVNASTSAS